MASVFYNGAKERAGTGALDPVAQAGRIMLLIGLTTTPDNPDREFVADVVADEASDASYGRHTVAGKLGTRNNTADRWEFDYTDPVFIALAGATIVFAIYFIFVTNDADSWLFTGHDIADTTPDGTDFKLVVGSTGAFHLT